MKLLELARSYYPSVGGFEKSIWDKTKIYDALGIDYKIITTDFNFPPKTGLRLPEVIYVKQYTPYNITPSLYKHMQGNYDVVNINLIGRFFSDAAIQYFSRRKTKIILTPHSFYHSERYSSIKRFVQSRVFPYLLKKIDMLVAFTEYEKTLWVSRYGVPPHRIVVIPHYIANNDLQKKEEATESREKYILYLGRNDVNKRPDMLLQSFLQLKQIELSLFLTLNENDLDPLLRAAVLSDKRIKLLGCVSDEYKNRLLQQADAVAVPTIWEAFGYVAFEASQYAKPLLCSNIPVFNELLDKKGVLFFDNTVESLAKTLYGYDQLTEEKKKKMGKHNQMNLRRFTFQESIRKYKTLFEILGHSS